jgi:raffinose/stachyose/melibiose transport system substrate-binding protein
MKRIALAAMLGMLAFAPAAQADTTVKWLHLETNPAVVDMMNAAVKEYEGSHPGVTIQLQFLENEAYKAKLTTLLQSNDAPDIIYSWGGGVLDEQVKAGVLRDIDSAASADEKTAIGPAGVGAFTRDSKLYGFAQHVSEVVFWYNKKLFAQAKLDPASMATWDGFLAGVKTLKAAGITPIALGGGDKWPTAFYWDYLAVRAGGQDEFNAAAAGTGDGFAGADYVEAGQKLLDLAALKPFQDGFQASTHDQSTGVFGDGKAAMMLMGDWAYQNQRVQSASKQGLSDDDLGMLPFPSIGGGKGDPTDTLGGINGWIFSKGASDEAVKFMQWYESKPYMSKAAGQGFFIPIVAGASDALANPFQQQIAKNINHAHWHAIFFDQELGPAVGGVVNDISEALAEQQATAQDAANQMKQAVADNK